MGVLDVSLASSFGVPPSAFANVMAAPLMALVTDCCRGLLSLVYTRAQPGLRFNPDSNQPN